MFHREVTSIQGRVTTTEVLYPPNRPESLYGRKEEACMYTSIHFSSAFGHAASMARKLTCRLASSHAHDARLVAKPRCCLRYSSASGSARHSPRIVVCCGRVHLILQARITKMMRVLKHIMLCRCVSSAHKVHVVETAQSMHEIAIYPGQGFHDGNNGIDPKQISASAARGGDQGRRDWIVFLRTHASTTDSCSIIMRDILSW
jgi:hypothetical protein